MLARLKSEVGDFLKGKLNAELEAQGHKATGNLADSIEITIKRFLDGWEIQGRFLHYGKYVDTGRAAGVKRVPLDALIEWIRVKRMDLRGKSERSVAFAIQTAIFKKGIPTDGDERKKRWISRTLEDNEQEIFDRIQPIMYQFVTVEFNNLVERTQKLLNEQAAAA